MINLTFLWGLVGVLFLAFIVSGIIHFYFKRKANNQIFVANSKARLHQFYQKAYVLCLRIPVIRKQIERIKIRLAAINPYDELTIRKKTMQLTLRTLALMFLGVVLFSLISRSLTGTIFAIMLAILINNLLITQFVKKEEDRLLYQLVDFLEEQRHEYQYSKSVDDSMSSAAQQSAHSIKLQMERIHRFLTSEHAEKQLDRFYQIAPNQYLKIYAGVSYLVMEYGDKVVQKGSMYLNALVKLVREIRDDLLRRSKLSYRLRNLTVWALIPILFTFPTVIWAETMFPVMKGFYHGNLGYGIRLFIYAACIICYLFVKKLGEIEDAKYLAPVPRYNWESKLYNIRFIKNFIDAVIPSKSTRKYEKVTSLLKQSNSPLKIEWFYIQRIGVGLACFVLTVVLAIFLHWNNVHQIMNSPTLADVNMVGVLDPGDYEEGMQRTEFDNQVIEQVKGVGDLTRNTIRDQVIANMPNPLDSKQLNEVVSRIVGKIESINNAYFKWYELIVALMLGVVGYFIPVWLLEFQKRMRELEMQNEVDQFHSLISILCEFDRISVQEILEWMERYALIFKLPLKKAFNNYDRGPELALTQLMEDAPFHSFVRIVKPLLRSVESISVKEAFDDLEMQQEFHRERKKEHMERLIHKKVVWGRRFGFLPLLLFVIVFLLFPFLYVSFNSMNDLMINLQNLM